MDRITTIRKSASNVIGWRTNRKIIVFESDDWGSIRTRSKEDYEAMLKAGLNVDNINFTKYDTLESNSDLESLYEVLYKHKDSEGRSAVFTPMCIVANPDFKRICESGFNEYHFETFPETCKKYPKHDKVHDLWLTGIRERLFVPALHGREHLSVKRWMSLLKSGNVGILKAFEHESFGASKYKGKEIPEYLGAFHPDTQADIEGLKNILLDAINLFESICGYKPTHFIAPNREGARELDLILDENVVKYLTMSKFRKYPKGDEKYGYEFNWPGKKNKNGQIYITRNCGFEPSDLQKKDWVNDCLFEIENAFKWKKPAVISTHRVNYIGHIDPQNSKNELKKLDILLTSIKRKWPEAEFMTSTELGKAIHEK